MNKSYENKSLWHHDKKLIEKYFLSPEEKKW